MIKKSFIYCWAPNDSSIVSNKVSICVVVYIFCFLQIFILWNSWKSLLIWVTPIWFIRYIYMKVIVFGIPIPTNSVGLFRKINLILRITRHSSAETKFLFPQRNQALKSCVAGFFFLWIWKIPVGIMLTRQNGSQKQAK